jgi:hypothetical protein
VRGARVIQRILEPLPEVAQPRLAQVREVALVAPLPDDVLWIAGKVRKTMVGVYGRVGGLMGCLEHEVQLGEGGDERCHRNLLDFLF